METFLRVAGLIVGVIILGSTAASVFTALVVPRATSLRRPARRGPRPRQDDSAPAAPPPDLPRCAIA